MHRPIPRAASLILALTACADPGDAGHAGEAFAPTFEPTASVPLDLEPRELAVADLDGDGAMDIAVAHQFSVGREVLILPGNGDGTFAAARRLELPGRAVSVTAIDLDGEGASDLVLASGDEERVYVALADGLGGFSPATSIAVAALPSGVRAADLDRDGHSDLVVAQRGFLGDPGETVGALLGNGDGSFGARADHRVGPTPLGLEVGDLDADGSADVAVPLGDLGGVAVLRGTDAGFGPGQTIATASAAHHVAVGDFDGDGRTDLVTADPAGSVLSLLRGQRSGGFEEELLPAAGEHPICLATGDLDGDATLDVIATHAGSAELTAYLAAGAGRLEPVLLASFPGAVRLGCVSVSDLDGDGRPDLAVLERGRDAPGTLHVLLGRPG